MGTVETFDHTADVGLRIAAGTLEDLFQTAAQGMFDYIVVNRDDVRPMIEENFTLRAESPAELLVKWLNELIFRSETTHRLYREFAVDLSGNGSELTAKIAGEAIDRDRHILDHEVKAVTHHGLSLQESKAGWVAEIILDI